MLRARLQTMFSVLRRRASFEDGLEDEIRNHIELRAADLKAAYGLTYDDALRQARIEFGGVENVREECRSSMWVSWFDETSADLRYACRTLAARPGFVAVAILTLALGIGANSAMFSVFDALVLRTLPVANPSELYKVGHRSSVALSPRYSWPFASHVRDVAERHGSGVAAMTPPGPVDTGADAEGKAILQLVSGEWFRLLGLIPEAGRLFTPEDNRQAGANPVAVVSRSYWRTLFGDSSFDNKRTVVLHGRSYEVVGIAPEYFRGVYLEAPVDVWVPLTMQSELGYFRNFSASNARPDQPWISQARVRWLDILVRAPEPRRAGLESMLNAGLQSEAVAPQSPSDLKLTMTPFARGVSSLRNQYTQPINVLIVAVALVLLIVCFNLANLLLSRAAARRREMAVRLSLGAGRGRLIRQMLTESVLLAIAGGLAGLVLADFGVAAVARMAEVSGGGVLDARVDWRVLLFTAVVSLAAALLFGFLPAWRSTAVDAGPALKDGARAPVGARSRLPKLLVASQVALSLVLLTSAGLFLRSLSNLLTTDPGFQPSRLLRVRLDTRVPRMPAGQVREIAKRAVDRVSAIDGVERAAASISPLVTGFTNTETGLVMTGYTPAAGEQVTLQLNAVTPGYFRTTGMRLLSGRELTDRDDGQGQKVVVVNEVMARRYFHGDAVGKSLGTHTPDRLIVGVVADARVVDLHEPAKPMLWSPLAEATSLSMPGLDIRVRGDEKRVLSDIRSALDSLDSRLRVTSVITMPEQIRTTLAREILLASFTSVFGGVALLLAAIGLYGVMSWDVARRTAEIGVRLALGASGRGVLWSTVGQSMAVVAAGLAVGLPVSIWGGRFVAKLLFGVPAGDPSQALAAGVVLLLSAGLAAFLPAWRASRVDPAVALRCE